MPHSPQEKKRVLARVRRIRGQCDALERALQDGADCAPVRAGSITISAKLCSHFMLSRRLPGPLRAARQGRPAAR